MSNYKNSIESGVTAIDITNDFVKATGEENFKKIKALLQWLQDKGYKSPILFGGALRDAYIGEILPRDYDIDVLNDIRHTEITLGTPPRSITFDIRSRAIFRPDDTAQIVAIRADAPINGIAMNRKGRIFAHPSFTEHAGQKLYQIRGDLTSKERYFATGRFEKLQTRYADLRRG